MLSIDKIEYTHDGLINPTRARVSARLTLNAAMAISLSVTPEEMLEDLKGGKERMARTIWSMAYAELVPLVRELCSRAVTLGDYESIDLAERIDQMLTFDPSMIPRPAMEGE